MTKQREKKISQNFLAKQKEVAEIEQNLRNAKSAIFMDYRGLTVAEANELRGKFREAGVTYKVYKNNLVRIALNNLGVTDLDDKLAGTLSVAFSMNDEISAAKIVKEAKFKDKMSFKFGVLGTSVIDEHGVAALATMPSKEQLIAQLMGLLQSGARGIASVVQAVPRNLAIVVNTRATA
ncbi:MAG: 50S ribosomal protein L10 [Firmicutes bacterium]|nr:50S ribosomal protein L10 [Bacillota bacterium]